MKKILITENELTFLNIYYLLISLFIITEENQMIKFFKKLKKHKKIIIKNIIFNKNIY